jgi:hypothetical protein
MLFTKIIALYSANHAKNYTLYYNVIYMYRQLPFNFKGLYNLHISSKTKYNTN